MCVIRKIWVGPNVLNSMTYHCGQNVLKGDYSIHSIRRDAQTQNITVNVIDASKQVFVWKEFNSTVPVSIEYDVDFFEGTSDSNETN